MTCEVEDSAGAEVFQDLVGLFECLDWVKIHALTHRLNGCNLLRGEWERRLVRSFGHGSEKRVLRCRRIRDLILAVPATVEE